MIQITKIRKEIWDITTTLTGTKMISREYCEKFSAKNLEILDEMGKFQEDIN